MSLRTMPATSAGCAYASIIARMPPSDVPTIASFAAPVVAGDDAQQVATYTAGW